MSTRRTTAAALLSALCTVAFSPLSQAATPPATAPNEAPAPQPGGYSNINNAQLQDLLDQGVVVIDIRREEEWRETGIVEGVTPITFFLGNGQVNPKFLDAFRAATDPAQPVALICRSGNRTQFASRAIAQQLGYSTVYNVTYGIKGWLAEKRPVVTYPQP